MGRTPTPPPERSRSDAHLVREILGLGALRAGADSLVAAVASFIEAKTGGRPKPIVVHVASQLLAGDAARRREDVDGKEKS